MDFKDEKKGLFRGLDYDDNGYHDGNLFINELCKQTKDVNKVRIYITQYKRRTHLNINMSFFKYV